MNRDDKNRRVERNAGRNSRFSIPVFRGIGYLLLVAAAFCTMIPLLWLLTSSFKTANEIFAVPVQWFPKFPPRVETSPYIVTDAYPAMKKPKAMEAATWKALQPQLEEAIWTEVQTHLSANARLANHVPSTELRAEVTEGIWHGLPNKEGLLSANPSSFTTEVRRAIIPEAIDTIWDAVYREVAVGTLQIEDVEFNRTPVADVKWEAASDTLKSIRVSEDRQTAASLSYDFQNDNRARLTAVFTSPIPIEQLRLITLPVRGDASYHRLSLTVFVDGAPYEPARPFVLESALWKHAVWRLQGIPGELESSHIPMHRADARLQRVPTSLVETPPQSRFPQPQTLTLELTLNRPPYLAIVWDKFTANYRNLWKTVPFNRYFINSVFIATASTLLTLFFCSLGGYAFAKYQFRGQKFLFGILLASMMVPFQVLLVPLFGLMYDIGWLNSYKAIIIPFSVGAFGVFLMRQFIVTIPTELLDAARIDGCSEFGIYYRIVLPIIKPALGALTIYSFLGSWNGYLWPLIILRDEAKYTLPIGLANLVGIYRQDYGMLMAGTLLSLMPIVILFLAMQREFVQGITLGSVKE